MGARYFILRHFTPNQSERFVPVFAWTFRTCFAVLSFCTWWALLYYFTKLHNFSLDYASGSHKFNLKQSCRRPGLGRSGFAPGPLPSTVVTSWRPESIKITSVLILHWGFCASTTVDFYPDYRNCHAVFWRRRMTHADPSVKRRHNYDVKVGEKSQKSWLPAFRKRRKEDQNIHRLYIKFLLTEQLTKRHPFLDFLCIWSDIS